MCVLVRTKLQTSANGVIARLVPGAISLIAVACPRVVALDPALDVSQYAHTAWKIREGFAKSTIKTIAQTPDGYLWFGTEFGLYRFDGVRTVLWEPPGNTHLPSSIIRKLLVARDGTLWIGTHRGLASWKDGKLTQCDSNYPRLRREDMSFLSLRKMEARLAVKRLAITRETSLRQA
jgi:ligand-binding sensor domain-containing protein